jgi:dehydrogenase/reductase SDR family protein 7B
MDDTTAKGLDPDELADTILRAVAAGKKEVVAAPLDARAAVFFRNLLPDVVFKILASKARKALQAPPAGGGSKRD